MGKTIFILIAITFSISVWGQNISVFSAQGENAASFLNTHMVGNGVRIFNVRHNGNTNISQNNIGSFSSNGFSEIAMDSGIILTTGDINVAVGPNNSSGMESPISSFTDSVLGSFLQSNVTSCSTLDFDFFSIGNIVSVLYCFASEEYPEYVCSSFNDVFAFLVTGTDPETGHVCTRNIAIIPGTISDENPNGIAVAINSVNPGTGGNPSTEGCYYEYSNYYISNTASTGIQYDGFTRKLSASADIIPNEVYHMHISVCNVSDNAYGSGVFLQGGSFVANENNHSPLHIWPSNILDTVAPDNHCSISLNMNATDITDAQVDISFSGSALNMAHFSCVTSSGQTITNINHQLHLTENDSLSLTLSPIIGPNLYMDLPFDMILFTVGKKLNDNGDTIQVAANDTLHFLLTADSIHISPVNIPMIDKQSVVIFPNPTNNTLFINAPAPSVLNIIDNNGIIVFSRKLQKETDEIDISHLITGVYVVRITNEQGSFSDQLIKQ